MAIEIYGHDESVLLRLTECSPHISWANVDNWRNVRHAFRGLTCVFHGVFVVYFVVECGHICVYS
ncbi:hypothetical protein [Prevotella pallens]|uniref:hypothetical protein n=1 Tax=Prevotella pallens TaxID=60133 RepID=UPI0028DB550B|nr:hypothetical protein [Prevotella pallens]